jgi:molecular chaperone DnaK (HSP70)
MTKAGDARALLRALGDHPDGQVPEAVRVLGIDLGTTNSTASEVSLAPGLDAAPVRAHTIEIPQSTQEGVFVGPLLPSMVAVSSSKVYVGEGAKRLRSASAKHGLRPYRSLFYDCKNEIGLQKTYHMAPRGLRSAAEVGSKVLGSLLQAAREQDETAFDRIVVTVPASFQVAQRTDTIRAAKLAGIELTSGDLLDEPLAVFLDYLVEHHAALEELLDAASMLLVFDFGGGTCDVAIFDLRPQANGQTLGVATLAVSRYHRLGGSDIDAAIVHDVLLPELSRQNEIGPHELGFEDKKRTLEPCLLGAAEALKIALCSEIRRLQAFGKLDAAARRTLASGQPVTMTIPWRGRELHLERPSLSLKQFESLLHPFLDQQYLGVSETEYRMTCSIFAPLRDSLDRAGRAPSDVDLCLMVGGSSLIPQVVEAVSAFLPRARVLTYNDAADVKTCVSRGAAYHALALHRNGRGLIRPSAGDPICLRHRDGHATLVARGTPLPFPLDGSYAEWEGFVFPETVANGVVPLRIELTTGDDGRALHRQRVELEGPVRKGDPLHLEYRIDANQVLHVRVRKAGEPASKARSMTVENPFTNIVNPGSVRQGIEELEEQLRTKQVAPSEAPARLADLSSMYAGIGQREKAAEYLARAIRMKGAPDTGLLGRLAMLYEDLGDTARADRHFQEALRVGDWTGTQFNYAVALRRRGDHARAWKILEPILTRSVDPPYLILAALLSEKLEEAERAKALLSQGLQRFDPVSILDDWQLGWFVTAGSMAQDEAREEAGLAEQRRRARRKTGGAHEDPGGMLPMFDGVQEAS